MATQQKKQDVPSSTELKTTQTTETAIAPVNNIGDLFARSVNGRAPIKALTLKRTLTKPLVAMAHTKQLAFECKGDMYIMDLPMKGRSGGYGKCRVIDGIDLVSGEEITLIINEVMASSFQKAGYASLGLKEDAEGAQVVIENAGSTLKGKQFAFRAGDVKEGKGFRAVDVVEIEVERG